MSLAAFKRDFANVISPDAARQAWHDHIVPAPGRIYFQAALGLGNRLK